MQVGGLAFRNTFVHLSHRSLLLGSSPSGRPSDFNLKGLLWWLYVGRLTLTLGVLVAVIYVGLEDSTEATRIATFMFMASVGMTGASFWFTHILGREAGQNLLYLHVVFDVALVTTIIHIMAGDPTFVPAYILVITEGALLLPLPGGMLIGALASILYFADQALVSTLSKADTLQIALFAVVALITGWLGDRVRRTGLQLGEVESELEQLRLDTGDILENISTGVLTVDVHGRLAFMNRAAQTLLRIDPNEWKEGGILDAVDAVSPGLASIIRRTIDRREASSRFKSAAHLGDDEVTLGISTTLLEREAYAPSVTAIFQDITDQERLALVRRRNERLEAVAELSASLAHEIKNPLASIRSSVEQMASGKLGAGDRAILERLVMSESDRLSRLLSDFLDFSVMKLGKRESVDMSRVVCDSVALVLQHPDAEGGPKVGVHGIEVPLLVPGDHDLIHRLVFNLVLNAVQFAGPEGSVRVTLEDVSSRPDPHGIELASPVRVTVEDSGPGISEEDVARVFDPFFTTREGGSGLGLALVHRAVEAHNGAVLVEPSHEGGAKFIIYLPGDDASERLPESPSNE